MLDRQDLVWAHDEDLNIPIGELLDERGVEFGDRYSRSALEAFGLDRELQCMPYGISPTVMYYNTDLVDFDRMAELGLDVPSAARTKWTFEQFAEAANFASRKRRGTKGVHVSPTLLGLAPFVYSGGPVFNDETDPTSLALNDDDSREALAEALRVLRDPTLTLSDEQLARRTPLQWFKAGKVAMIPGDRSLVPELRRVRGPGLRRDPDAGHRVRRDGRRHHRPLRLLRRPFRAGGRRLRRARAVHRVGARGDARGLPGTRQPGGRAQRGLPAARDASPPTPARSTPASGRCASRRCSTCGTSSRPP